MFGPEYCKIQTAFERDEHGVIIPGAWTLSEFAYLADKEWRWTEKVDGTNIRLYWNGVEVKVGGRTDNAQVPATLIANLAPVLDAELWKSIFPDANDVTVYGEGYGAKIQSGGMYRQDQALVVFDVRVGSWWLTDYNVADVASKLGLDVVPSMPECWTLKQAWYVLTQTVNDPGWSGSRLASAWPDARIEGLVGRPLVNLFCRNGDRLIVKMKVKDYTDFRRRGGSGGSEP